MIKTIIFDMDGVIFDTENLWLNCWGYLGGKYGIENPEGALEPQRRRRKRLRERIMELRSLMMSLTGKCQSFFMQK